MAAKVEECVQIFEAATTTCLEDMGGCDPVVQMRIIPGTGLFIGTMCLRLLVPCSTVLAAQEIFGWYGEVSYRKAASMLFNALKSIRIVPRSVQLSRPIDSAPMTPSRKCPLK